jgi:hypothetical protein
MRYPQGGGLTAERQQFRAELRLRAAERFARGEPSSMFGRHHDPRDSGPHPLVMLAVRTAAMCPMPAGL